MDIQQKNNYQYLKQEQVKKMFSENPRYWELKNIEVTLLNEYIKPNDKILVVGCGAGRITEYLYYNKYKNITGIDQSKKLIAKCHLEHKSKVKYINSDLRDFESKEKYDVIIAPNQVLDFIYPFEDRQKCIQKLRDLLKYEGLLIYSAHKKHFNLLKLIKKCDKKQMLHYLRLNIGLKDWGYYHNYTAGGLTLFYSDEWFNVKNMYSMMFQTVYIEKNNNPNCYYIFKKKDLCPICKGDNLDYSYGGRLFCVDCYDNI
jgi:2-polyprenyl-3-methyl-5-hydroxy-6-metoxy-1,4-benzoquinol methylase